MEKETAAFFALQIKPDMLICIERSIIIPGLDGTASTDYVTIKQEIVQEIVLNSLLNNAFLLILQPLCILLAGVILARAVPRLDIRSVAAPCMFILFPAYFYIQAAGQNLNVLNPVFTFLLFFYLFHTVILYWITKGLFILSKFTPSLHHLNLLFVLIPSVQGLRVIQNSVSLQADSNLLISMISFYETVIAASIGVYLIHAHQGLTTGLRRIVMNPLIYAVLLGIGFAVAKYQPPYELTGTVDRLYAATMPVAVILTGMAFGKSIYLIDKNSFLPYLPGALLCAVFRLMVSPLLAWAVTYWMGMDNTAVIRGVILASGLPTGIFAMVITGVYGKQEQQGYAAFVIVITSLFSFITIPLLIMLIDKYYPL